MELFFHRWIFLLSAFIWNSACLKSFKAGVRAVAPIPAGCRFYRKNSVFLHIFLKIPIYSLGTLSSVPIWMSLASVI